MLNLPVPTKSQTVFPSIMTVDEKIQRSKCTGKDQNQKVHRTQPTQEKVDFITLKFGSDLNSCKNPQQIPLQEYTVKFLASGLLERVVPDIFFPDVNSKIKALKRWNVCRDCWCDMWHHARSIDTHVYLGQRANDHTCNFLASCVCAFATAARDPFVLRQLALSWSVLDQSSWWACDLRSLQAK